MESLLPSLINLDHTGFIWNCQELKAFDRVDCRYLFNVLRSLANGVTFSGGYKLLIILQWLASLQTAPALDPFQGPRGIRHGCPLSPVLLTIVLEHLAVINLLFMQTIFFCFSHHLNCQFQISYQYRKSSVIHLNIR